jgi:hypothetical protein
MGQVVRNLSQAAREGGHGKFLSQLVREIDGENLPRAAADIPWGHNMVLIFSLSIPGAYLSLATSPRANQCKSERFPIRMRRERILLVLRLGISRSSIKPMTCEEVLVPQCS